MAYRKEKLEELIKRLISDLIIKGEIKDPRIGFVTITRVDLSRDYSEAYVGISVLGDPREIRKTFEGLKSATNFIQYKIGKSIRVKTTPRIEFKLDSSIADGTEMVGLLNKLEAERDDDAYEQLTEHDDGNSDE